jgi:hypothetical protein
MATWTGWIAAGLILLAALVPLVNRIVAGKRAAPDSGPTRAHVLIGLATSAVTFGHTVVAVQSLGSAEAVGAGMIALLPGGAAFFLLVAHAGLGLQLRDVKLRDRAKKRRAHTTTAIAIAIAVGVHAGALLKNQ